MATRQLHLYTNFTPNTEGQAYFNIKVLSNYVAYCDAHYLSEKVDVDNYRINTNVVRITATASRLAVANNITYIIDHEAGVYTRCYFVDAVTIQSGYILLSVSIDFWGSYYLAGNIDYLHITRCNRNIGNGLYDDIKVTKGRGNNALYLGGVQIEERLPARYLPLSSIMLVASISYNIFENSTGTKNVSTTTLFCIKLDELRDKYKEWNDDTYLPNNIFEIISDFLGGIVGVDANIGNNEANVNFAFLIPTDVIERSLQNAPILKIKSILLGGSQKQLEPFHVIQQRKIVEYSIDVDDLDINKAYYLGVEHDNGLLIPRFTQNFKVYYCVEAKETDLNVYCYVGEKQFDIRDNFIIDITQNTNYTSIFKEIVRAYTASVSAYKSMSKSLATGGKALAGLDVVSSVATATNLGGDASLNKEIKGNGDATITYYRKANDAHKAYLFTPFAITEYESINDEDKKARYYGANFNEYVDNINSIFAFDLLGAGTYDYDLTFVIADEVKVDNTPTNARNKIESAFNAGVELFDYEQ